MYRVRWGIIGVAAIFIVAATEAALLATHWPFTRRAVIAALREQARGDVTIRDFHEVFFPRPGCVVRGLKIHRGSGSQAPPLITVDRLTVAGDYGGLLTFSKHLQDVRAEGMHIRIPPKSSGAAGGRQSESAAPAAIDRFIAERSVLEFAPEDPDEEPFVIQIHRAVLSPARADKPISFETSLRVPEPPGEVRASGRFGPWRKGSPFLTPVSGSYRFEGAELGKFEGIAGTLDSTGRFEGALSRIEVSGETKVPNFEIRGTSHRVPLNTRFQATVNGETGDVRIRHAEAVFLHTAVIAEGAVAAAEAGGPKTVSLDLRVKHGRIEDLLRLVSSGRPGLAGGVTLHFRVRLPPGDAAFLKKLRLEGQMGVYGGRFSNPATQQTLERVSANAFHGEDDPADVVSDLRGRIAVSRGVATLSGVTFNVPGATAAMSGTYQLITRRVDLRGNVRLRESLSDTSKGLKSFLLKALDPFFKKKKHLSVVPVRITGRYGNTSVKLDL